MSNGSAHVYSFYPNLLQDLVGGTDPQRLIVGGRGLGKTTLLRMLATEVNVSKWVDGVGKDVIDHLEALAREDPSGLVIIDDLDRPFLAMTQENVDRARRAVELVLNKNGQRRRVVATARIPGDLVGEKYRDWSDLWQRFTTKHLDPWEHGWRTRVEAMFIEIFRKSKWRLIEPAVARCWIEAVFRTSGGHPALLGRTIALLERMLETKRSAKLEEGLLWPSVVDDAWQKHLRCFLEDDLVETALLPISKAIAALRDEAPAAYQHLVRMARSSEGGQQADAISRRRLRIDGLGHLNERSHTLEVVEGLVRAQVIASSQSALVQWPEVQPRARSAQATIELRLEASQDDAGGGTVRARQEGIDLPPLDLAPKEWRVLWTVCAKRGEPVSLEELSYDGKGVRSTIQRLASKLQSVGLQWKNILENVYGRGYRMSHLTTVIFPEQSDLPAVKPSAKRRGRL